MMKSKNTKLISMFLTLAISAMAVGCGAGTQESTEVTTQQTENAKEESTAEKAAEAKSESSGAETETVTEVEEQKIPESEKDLSAFMEGEWNLVNPVTLDDYGQIKIAADGSFTYGYTGSNESCQGVFEADHQYPGEENVPLSFSISVSGLDKMTFDNTIFHIPDDGKDSTHAKLYYGSCDGEDFLYMEETGNGDSFTGTVLFQDPKNVDGSFFLSSSSFIMRRKSSLAAEATAGSGDFYAWVWKADDGGIWAQEMKPLTWDDENEYTLNRFTAAAFMPEKMGSVYYKYSDSVNKKLLLNGRRLEMEYPRYMCKLTVGADGSLSDIEEVDSAFYGMYDLGDREPEISYSGMTFTYNGVDYDLSEMGAGNAIMDVYHAYGKEIVECHVNPHTGLYYIFDKFRGEFCSEPIQGTNLIWLGDDFTTAIYANWSEVRDLCGDLMYYSDCDEILTLGFADEGRKVNCSAVKTGDAETYEEAFEMPDRRDGAMNAYCNYCDSGRASDYRKFMEYAPDDAMFFAVTDPQIWAQDLFFLSDMIEPSAVNQVLVVALEDSSVVDVYQNGEKCTDTEYLDKGRSCMYKMTVSESMPLYTVSVTTPYQGKEITTQWPVVMFSGETYTHCRFITK